MRILALYLCLALVAGACGEEAYTYRSATDNIYFDFADTSKSRITFSFAYPPDVPSHAVRVPVRISGPRVPRDRIFRVEVIPELTTAMPGLHYEALAASYTMAADSGTFSLPVELFKSDPLLEDSTMVIAFRLVPTADFTTDLPLVSAVISFSNRLEKPAWWDINSWSDALGVYSRNKHFLFLATSGTIDLNDPSTDGEKTIQSLNHVQNFKAFMFDPPAWVARHPAYAFDETVPGAMFEFYEKANPDKKIACMLMNMGTMGTRYAFFDDNNSPSIFYI
jgi:hypothetical protein